MTKNLLIHRALLLMIPCILTIMIIAPGCSRSASDPRLALADSLIESRPDSALTILDGISSDSLPPTDGRFYNFLKIKAADKAYIEHSSDSLLLEVISAYTAGDSIYPEVLYYGGRVYSDLGDYPSSLRYFQKSLDALEKSGEDNYNLKIRILSQTGRLLNTMRLYDEAVEYINRALEIERMLSDTVKIINDLHLIGGIYLRADEYSECEKYFREAWRLSNEIRSSYLQAKSRMYLAATKYYQDSIPEALTLIRGVTDRVSPIVKNHALGYAADIYMKAGVKDTAKMYIDELIHSSQDNNKDIGYHIALHPDLRECYPIDTINEFVFAYRALLEKFYDNNMQQFAIIQQATYNYENHKRKRLEAESSIMRLRRSVYLSVILLLVMAVVIIYLKYRNQRIKFELLNALGKLNELFNAYEKGKNVFERIENNDNVAGLREQLRNQLLSLYEESKNIPISPEILESAAYVTLHELISDEKVLHEKDGLWKDLIVVIEKVSHNFRADLRLLCDGKVTENDLQTAILIKCGISVTDMTILFCKSKGAIDSRLRALGKRIFGENISTRIIQGIIRLL